MSARVFSGESQIRLEVTDPSHVGECRRTAQRLAQANDFDATAVGRVGIIATELANNIIRHAQRGEVLIQILVDGAFNEIELVAIDRGPGLHDTQRCLQDGFSTAGTPGTGMGAISRLSTTFDLHSHLGKGTVVLSRVASTTSSAATRVSVPALQFGAVCVAIKGEIECGDAWRVAIEGESIALCVADGLGHGPLAAAAAQQACRAFGEHPFNAPADTMRRLHGALCGTRGAAAACAALHDHSSKVHYAGVGNISGTVVTAERSRGMVSHNGTLGVQLLRAQQFEYDWPQASCVIMHTDGLSARWSVGGYDDLFSRHAAVIAAVLYRDHARPRDDATVLVARRRQ